METSTPVDSKQTASPLALVEKICDRIIQKKPECTEARFILVAISIALLFAFSAAGKIPPSFGFPSAVFFSLGYAWLTHNSKTPQDAAVIQLLNTVLSAFPKLHQASLTPPLVEILPHTNTPETQVAAAPVSMTAQPSTGPALPAGQPGGAADGEGKIATVKLAPVVPPAHGDEPPAPPPVISRVPVSAILAFFAVFILGGCAARTTFWDVTTGKKVAEFQGDMTDSDWTGGKKPHWKVGSVSHSAATDAMGRAVGHIVNQTGKAATSVGLAVGLPGSSQAVNAAGKAAGLGTVLSNPATPTPSAAPGVKTH